MTHIGIFWPEIMGYLTTGVRELLSRGYRVTVFADGLRDVQAEHELLAGGARLVDTRGASWRHLLDDIDAALICGWHVPEFRRAADRLEGRCARVLYFDTQWRGSLRQRGGRLIAQRLIHSRFDACFVPGPSQAAFARRVGFQESQIHWGSLTCDFELFSSVPPLDESGLASRRNFLFAGRLAREKAVDVLLDAYAEYREAAITRDVEPWGLEIAGAGPLLDGRSMPRGTRLHGHQRPENLRDLMAGSACLVLPSRFEPYGVILQEAAAAALPIVTTPVSGAVHTVVDPGRTGYLVAPGDRHDLARCLGRVSILSASKLGDMGRGGRAMAQRYEPSRWADSFLQAASLPSVSP